MKITIDEITDNLAGKKFVESLGFAPKENEALFTRMRVKKYFETDADVIEINDNEIVLELKNSKPLNNAKDGMLEIFFINEWEKAYSEAISEVLSVRIAKGEITL